MTSSQAYSTAPGDNIR